MMMYPPIEKLMEKLDSRYSLVIAVAKRARELAEGKEVLVKCTSDKEVTEAVYELYEGKIKVILPNPKEETKREDQEELEG